MPLPDPHGRLGPAGYPIRFPIGPLTIEPAVALAPMEGVTDLSFRRVIRSVGGAGLTYTEFIASCDAVARKRRPVAFDPDERPIALQIFGRDPEIMAEAARRLESDGASVIDINMGCPSKRVCARSGGSGLGRETPGQVRLSGSPLLVTGGLRGRTGAPVA